MWARGDQSARSSPEVLARRGHSWKLQSERIVGNHYLGLADDTDCVWGVGRYNGSCTSIHSAFDAVENEHDATPYDVPHLFLFVLMFMQIAGIFCDCPARERHVL